MMPNIVEDELGALFDETPDTTTNNNSLSQSLDRPSTSKSGFGSKRLSKTPAKGSKRKRVIVASESESESETDQSSFSTSEDEGDEKEEIGNLEKSSLLSKLSGFDHNSFVNSWADKLASKYLGADEEESDQEEIDMNTLEVVSKKANKRSSKKQSPPPSPPPRRQSHSKNKSSTSVKPNNSKTMAKVNHSASTSKKATSEHRQNADETSSVITSTPIPAINSTSTNTRKSLALVRHQQPGGSIHSGGEGTGNSFVQPEFNGGSTNIMTMTRREVVSMAPNPMYHSAVMPYQPRCNDPAPQQFQSDNKEFSKLVNSYYTRNAFTNLPYQKAQLNQLSKQLFEEPFDDQNIAHFLIELAAKIMSPLPRSKPNIVPIIRVDNQEVPLFEWYYRYPTSLKIPLSQLVNYIDDEILNLSSLIYQFLEIHFPERFQQH